MKILISTPAMPTYKNPVHGIFIGERISQLKAKGHCVDFVRVIHPEFPGSLTGIIKKFIFPIYCIYKNLVSQNKGIGEHKSSLYLFYYISYSFDIYNIVPHLLFKLSAIRSYSLIHIHFLWAAKIAFEFAKKVNLPVVITAHGNDVHESMEKDLDFRLESLAIMRQSDALIFVSKFLKKKAQSLGLQRKDSKVIMNGYNPDIFFPEISNLEKKPVVGFLGSLYEIKRADQFPEIFEFIKIRIPDVKFILVGEGASTDSLRPYLEREFAQKKMSNKVKFTGDVLGQEVGNFVRQFSVMIFPSRMEGLGCAIIEARACGIPVIGSDNGGVPEAIDGDGIVVNEGLNFNQRFADAVVHALTKACFKWERISNHTHDLTWSKIVDREIEVYEQVLVHPNRQLKL